MISYVVHATFTTPALREEWITWLAEGHLAEIIAAGAEDAEVTMIDGDPPRAEARYRFSTRVMLDRYLQHHAPRLRAEGLKRFPDGSGVVLARSTGEVVLSLDGLG